MNKKRLLIIITIGVLIVAGIVAFNFYTKIYAANTTEDKTIFITTNSNFENIVSTLKPILKNKNSFIWVAKKKNYPNKIKAGKYSLKKGMNNNDLINLLRSGNQTPINLSFNNQDSLEKLAGRIAQQIEADSTTILKAIIDHNFLSKNNFNIETALGMYIPNSYQVYWNISVQKFRNKMFSEYQKFWSSDKIAKAKKQNLSIEQVITLASIVQKETQTINERPKVAQLYLNRLNNKWLLQADPTIIFAIKEKKGQDIIIKRVLFKDLEIDSKYNTYKNIGLPPGPIGMPDISAINAVLNPSYHNYYFMCVDTQNLGQHLFAKTLSQHNKNAAKYQKWLTKQGITR